MFANTGSSAGTKPVGFCMYNCGCQSEHGAVAAYAVGGTKSPPTTGTPPKVYTGDTAPGVGIITGEGEKVAAGGEFWEFDTLPGDSVCGDVATSGGAWGLGGTGLLLAMLCVVVVGRGRR